MNARVLFAVLAILVAVPSLAGCFDGGSPAAVGSPASKAETLLNNPPGSGVVPTGKTVEFDLYVHTMRAHSPYPGVSMEMWAFSLDPDPATATVPGPELRVTEGDLVRVRLVPISPADFNHTVHWHGQHVPWDMDGVPFVSQVPVGPGDPVFTYEFIAKPAGTYWYHCHVDAQHHIDMGMYGALIVEPQDPRQDPAFDREYTLILDEMDRNHITGLGVGQGSNAPQNGDPFSYPDWATRQTEDGLNKNQQYQETIHQTPVAEPRDWYPVTYPAYDVDYNTYMINGVSFPYTEPAFIKEGGTVRLRFINVGNMMHAMHLHGHHMLVTHKDGILLENPYWADTIAIAPGERYDAYVRGDNPGIWDLHDHFTNANRNDEIYPGGMMMMFVYDAFKDQVDAGGHQHGGLLAYSRPAAAPGTLSGDYVIFPVTLP